MRALILKALKEERHISGEQLGKRFNISRTAVWKHINELRGKGYEIRSSPRLGYTFIKSTDLLLADEIASCLKTRFMGKRILHHDEVTSTQDVAENLARAGEEQGTVVIAEAQTRGRGRRGRSWVSLPEGGIYLSIILKPELMPSQVVQIPLIAGVAVCKAIRKMTRLEPRIKWSNDILISGKKVAGILAEMSSEFDRVNFVILGIGVNVNTRGSTLAKLTGGIAASLAGKSSECISRVQLVQSLLQEFEKIYIKFLSSGFNSIREEWKTYDGTIGSQVSVVDGGTNISGKAIDIDNDGFLLIKKANGEVKKVISGDISVIKRNCEY